MKISSNYNLYFQKKQMSFGSRFCPVRNFCITTTKGDLLVREIRFKDDSFHFSNKVSKFFNDNFIDGSTDPLWKEYLKPQMHKQYKEKNVRFAEYLRNIFKTDDGHTTLLVALDRKNRIKAAVLGLTFNESKVFKDEFLYSIDALAVDSKYRGLGVAKILLNRVLSCVDKSHTDAVLTGYENAIPFYKKLGFSIFTPDNKQKQFFYEIIKGDRDDIPSYTKVLTKPLDTAKERFYNRINVLSVYVKMLKNWFNEYI